ncbi:methyl-accepting chemotaxis protein [Noviherbaspirillum sp. Root189]|uniref:methyl-accepting chemotaxis protein n=1 Tax=Noviherbaspirillum sp. Root189 TaxID=1736487 RepID=UPI0009E92784|nr:methyl-accepting chemotaxis protein [Noviherbaspirillum sp. Root189]
MKNDTNNMTIGRQMSLAFILVLAFLAVTTALSLWYLEDVATRTRTMMSVPLAKERLVSDWYRNVHTGVRRTAAIAVSTDSSVADFFAAEIAATTKDSSEIQQKIAKMLSSSEEKALFREIVERRQAYLDIRAQIDKAKANASLFEANTLLENQFLPTSAQYLDAVNRLLAEQRKSIDASAREIDEISRSSRITLLIVGFMALAVGAFAATLIVRRLLARLGGEPAYAVQIAEQIANGDLAASIDLRAGDRSSLLYAMKTMRDKLAGIVAQVRVATDAVATASNEIASGNVDLSSRTEEQASSLAETASSMEQLTGTVKLNADNAHEANAIAGHASKVAGEGGIIVSQVMNTMGAINDSSRRIVDIIAVIDGIAFQTNILALNAAVEAARAGEQGRGFAVVAAEVRSLAKRSADAAKEVKDLIGDTVGKVHDGSLLVNQAGAKMNEIVKEVNLVNDLIGRISVASQEQSSGIGQVSLAVEQMDEATQQNAALVEEAAAAAQSLKDQAGKLVEVVSGFRLDADATVSSNTDTTASALLRSTTGGVPMMNTGVAPVHEKVSRSPVLVTLEGTTRPTARAPLATTADGWEEF